MSSAPESYLDTILDIGFTPLIKLSIGGVPEHFNLPWHRLLGSGYLAGQGIEASWRDYLDGTGAMVAALDAGELDVALLLTEGAVAGADRGGRFRILSLYTETPLIWGIHVPAAGPVQAVDELAGTRFAISRFGSGSHLMSFALAAERGWQPEAQRFVVVGSLGGAIESFRNGESDVFLWERFMTQPVVDRGEFRRIDDFVAPWPAFVLAASNDAVREKLDAIERIVAGVGEEASRLAAAADAPATIAARYGLAEESAARWLKRTRWATGWTSPDAAVEAARSMLRRAGAR